MMKIKSGTGILCFYSLALVATFPSAAQEPAGEVSSGAAATESLLFLFAAYESNLSSLGPLAGTATIRESVVRELETSLSLQKEQPDSSVYPLLEANVVKVSFECDPLLRTFRWVYEIESREYTNLASGQAVEFSSLSTFFKEEAYVADGLYIARDYSPPNLPPPSKQTIQNVLGLPVLKYATVRSEAHARRLLKANVFEPTTCFSPWGDSQSTRAKFEKLIGWSKQEGAPGLASQVTLQSISEPGGMTEGFELMVSRVNPTTGVRYEEICRFDPSSGYNMTSMEALVDGRLAYRWSAEFAPQGTGWLPTRTSESWWDPQIREMARVARDTEFNSWQTISHVAGERLTFESLFPGETCIAVIDYTIREAQLYLIDPSIELVETYFLSPNILPIPKDFTHWLSGLGIPPRRPLPSPDSSSG